MLKRRLIGIYVLSVILVSISVVYLYAERVAPYPAARYRNLLERLIADGYVFILPRHYGCVNSSKLAIIVHDVDFSVSGVAVFISIESEMHIKSGFYIRPDADYFTQNVEYFQALEQQGWEIGFHYDCLSRSSGDLSQASRLFEAQLVYLRTFFNISTTRYHGDSYNLNIVNRDLYVLNQNIWRQNGLKEISNLEGWSYISDTNHQWSQPEKLGNFVLINLHSDWW